MPRMSPDGSMVIFAAREGSEPAVLHLRQHLQEHGDNPHVHAKIAVCYLQLDEVRKALPQAAGLLRPGRHGRQPLRQFLRLGGACLEG